MLHGGIAMQNGNGTLDVRMAFEELKSHKIAARFYQPPQDMSSCCAALELIGEWDHGVVDSMLSRLAQPEQLRELTLRKKVLSQEHLGVILERLPWLRTLHCFDCEPSQTGLELKIICEFSALEVLVLNRLSIDNNIARLISSRTLTTLDLMGCKKLNDAVTTGLSSRLPSLKKLYIGGTSISTDAIEAEFSQKIKVAA